MALTSESEAHRWGSDPDHGEIGPVLKSHEAELALILGPEFPIWVGCRCSLLAQSLPRRSPLLPFGAPMPCAAGSSYIIFNVFHCFGRRFFTFLSKHLKNTAARHHGVLGWEGFSDLLLRAFRLLCFIRGSQI